MSGRMSQNGQAAIEGIIIMTLMSILMIGVVMTGRMQLQSVDMLLDSHRQSLNMHKGQALVINQHATFSNTWRSVNDRKGDSAPIDQGMFKELRLQEPGLIQVSARLHNSTQFLVSNLYRQSFVEAGTGHASSADAVQRGLHTSTSLWRDARDRSVAVITARRPYLAYLDRPWGRESITVDWLRPWTDVVPDQILKDQ